MVWLQGLGGSRRFLEKKREAGLSHRLLSGRRKELAVFFFEFVKE
jgi:hypothetical protein